MIYVISGTIVLLACVVLWATAETLIEARRLGRKAARELDPDASDTKETFFRPDHVRVLTPSTSSGVDAPRGVSKSRLRGTLNSPATGTHRR